MQQNDTQLEEVIAKAMNLNKRIGNKLVSMQIKASQRQYQEVYALGFEAVNLAEKQALLCRSIPCYTGHPAAMVDLQTLLQNLVPIELGFTVQGWFVLRMPLLLPKKEKGSDEYIRSILYPSMRRFFEEKASKRFERCVLIFRHVYDQNRPEREYRDHDNIELNAAVDAVALHTMMDDMAMRCRHFYCSAAGPKESTEVYVVPNEEFTAWLAMEQDIPVNGMEMAEGVHYWDEKDMEK